MKFFPSLLLVLLGFALAAPATVAQTAESKAETELQALVERQRQLLTTADKAEEQADLDDLRAPLQQLVFDYEKYLRENPAFAAGYASYAALLGHPILDERRRAVALLLKANQILAAEAKPDTANAREHVRLVAHVQNQLGKYLAEEGKPQEALNYFVSAARLLPNEPLYHFQIGQLLTAARDDFLKSGEWKADAVDRTRREAFEKALALAPDDFAIAYAYGKSLYAGETPDWAEVQRRFELLLSRAKTEEAQQLVRLQIALAQLRQKKFDDARATLDRVNAATLLEEKEKLVAQLPADGEK